jgi:hypothetical protein
MARRKIKREGLLGDGMAIAGLILGYLFSAGSLIYFGFIFFAMKGVGGSANNVISRVEMGEILNAVNLFKNEYSVYPAKDPSGGDWQGPLRGNVVDTLSGSDTTVNNHGRNFIVGMRAKVIGGFPTLADPWGNAYQMALDGDGDGQLPDPKTPGAQIMGSVLIWSAGRDGDPTTWSDNVELP